MSLSIQVENSTDVDLDTDGWRALADSVLQGEGRTTGICFVGFVGPTDMQKLNLEHMGKDRPTDVLSFPIDADIEPSEVPSLIGDVILCPQIAFRQATEHGWPEYNELALLLVHGVLHLLGHDHQQTQERQLMRSLEKKYLATLDIEHKVFDD